MNLAKFKTISAALGKTAIAITLWIGRVTIIFFKSLIQNFVLPFQFSKIVNQIYFIGAKSVFIICLTGAFTGMILGIQGYYTLIRFGSEGLLGSAVALSIIRELGPVLTAIMITARAGSAMASEIGIMRNSEQIDALNTMDINPIRFLISPRLTASLISFPLLTAIFDIVGILGGSITCSALLGIEPDTYFFRVESDVLMKDVSGGFIKSFVFAGIVATICCSCGYYTHKKTQAGAKGVSYATTSAVVISCVMILAADYILTSILL